MTCDAGETHKENERTYARQAVKRKTESCDSTAVRSTTRVRTAGARLVCSRGADGRVRVGNRIVSDVFRDGTATADQQTTRRQSPDALTRACTWRAKETMAFHRELVFVDTPCGSGGGGGA